MSDSKIGVAIIGSGIFVTDEHLPAVQACDSLELEAIYSRSLTSAQKLTESLPRVDLYSEDSERSFKDLLARTDIQAVIIALPIPVAPAFIKLALSAGKHVLAEKPLAKDVATAVELLDWYRKHIDTKKIFFSIAENWRYLEAFARAAERIHGHGKVQGFNVRVHVYLPDGWKYTTTEWRTNPQYQGGYILDSGVHLIAALRRMLGQNSKIKRVSAFVAAQAAHLPPVDTVAATFQLENGFAGTFSMSFGTRLEDSNISVACEGGTISADFSGGSKMEVKSKVVDSEESTETVGNEVSDVKLEVAAWAKSIERGVPEGRLSPWEALADLEVIEAILTSDGNPIELKYQV